MGVLFDQYPGEGKLGSQITISDGDIMLFVSERDEVFLYTGICMNDEDKSILQQKKRRANSIDRDANGRDTR